MIVLIIIVIILSLPLVGVATFYVYRFFKIKHEENQRLLIVDRCEFSYRVIDNEQKFIIMAEASVGGGKSSLGAAISHYNTLKYRAMAQNKINWTKKVVFKANYNYLNGFIEKEYSQKITAKKIYSHALNDKLIFSDFSGEYDDYLSKYDLPALLKDYITAYTAILRNNYVCSSYKLYNRITNTFAYAFNSTQFDIKDKEARKNYYILPYCFYLEDEKTLTEYKNTCNFKEQDNKGQDTVLRLIRHLKKETTSYMSLAQDTARIAKLIRELTNTRITIDKMSIVGNRPYLSSIYSKKEQREARRELRAARRYRKKINVAEGDTVYLNQFNSHKLKRFKFLQLQKKIFASSFVKYSISLTHKKVTDQRVAPDDVEKYDLYFPISWCFGVYLTTEFSEFDEFLNNLSNKDEFSMNVIKSFYDDSKEVQKERFNKLIEVPITKAEEEEAKRIQRLKDKQQAIQKVKADKEKRKKEREEKNQHD